MTLPQTSKTLFRELDRLKAFYARLSGRLDDAGKQFRKSGVPLPESLVSELTDFNAALTYLGNRVLELGGQLSLPEERLSELPVAALDSLDRSLRQIAEIEERQGKWTIESESQPVSPFPAQTEVYDPSVADESILKEPLGENFFVSSSDRSDGSNRSLLLPNPDVKHAIEEFLLLTASEVESAVMETIKLQRIADLYRDEGKYSLAIALYEKLLAAQKKIYGADDPRVSRTGRTLEAIYCIQEANARPQVNPEDIRPIDGRSRRSPISSATVFGAAVAVLSYAAIYYWPMNADALLWYMRAPASNTAASVSHPALERAAVQPGRAIGRPKVTLRQKGSGTGAKVQTRPGPIGPAEELKPRRELAQPTAEIKEESEPPHLTGLIQE